VHCVVPAGGLAPDHRRWVCSRYRRFLLPVKVLGKVFRGKFTQALKDAFRAGQLRFPGLLKPFATSKGFAQLLRCGWRHGWVVYAKAPFGGPEHVLNYLGNYTHRVAISSHRLLSLEDGKVAFRWRDSAHGNQQRVMSLPVDEFLRRFLLHVLPRGFVRIRYFGFLAHRRRTRLLPLCRELISDLQARCTQRVPAVLGTSHRSFWRCPLCGGAMVVIEHLTAAQLLLRCPPTTRSP
jgi:putative transposase